MRASYAWTIDWANPEFLDGEAGIAGPRNMHPTLKKLLTHAGEGTEFRMYDDDGIHYYTGRIVGDYEGFEPLDDFGMGNAGCTDIRYRDAESGDWQSL